MRSVHRDIRYGVRSLRQNPGFAAVAVLSLALGIGANTTIFSVTNALLYRPLPFREPERLVLIHEQNRQRENWQRQPTLATLLEWRRRATTLEQTEGIVPFLEGNTISTGDTAERVNMQFVSPGAFSLLGVSPIVGREFTPEESAPGNRALLISYGLWQRRFAGSPGVLGRTLHYGGTPVSSSA